MHFSNPNIQLALSKNLYIVCLASSSIFFDFKHVNRSIVLENGKISKLYSVWVINMKYLQSRSLNLTKGCLHCKPFANMVLSQSRSLLNKVGCTLSKVLHQQELESEFDSKDVE